MLVCITCSFSEGAFHVDCTPKVRQGKIVCVEKYACATPKDASNGRNLNIPSFTCQLLKNFRTLKIFSMGIGRRSICDYYIFQKHSQKYPGEPLKFGRKSPRKEFHFTVCHPECIIEQRKKKQPPINEKSYLH